MVRENQAVAVADADARLAVADAGIDVAPVRLLLLMLDYCC